MKNKKQLKKKKFEVTKNDTIESVLQQMRSEGYMPVRRIEKPVFKETENGIEVSHQEIVFEGKLID
ncbi:NETI motif-containing protein [Nosocomiicoccus massiliensis]|uniref:NETI motif-containing protein n=1 Tax=Nosocomiicoccus massiliensis TaxID=1232430 RepID=UPI000426290B|nr:NETI motif-containing protein [Nosocomiicoccus massiliensis]